MFDEGGSNDNFLNRYQKIIQFKNQCDLKLHNEKNETQFNLVTNANPLQKTPWIFDAKSDYLLKTLIELNIDYKKKPITILTPSKPLASPFSIIHNNKDVAPAAGGKLF